MSQKDIRLSKKELKNTATTDPKQSDEYRAEVERISLALEAARQTVKPLVKRLVEAELVDEELMNLRLQNW